MELHSLFATFVNDGRYLRGWSPRTVAIYQAAFDSYQKFKTGLEGQGEEGTSPRAGLVTKRDVDGWLVWMRGHERSAGGCNVHLRSMNSFLSWLYEAGHTTQKVRVRTLPNPAKPLPSFSDAEVRSLMAYKPRNVFQGRSWLLTLCLMDTGIRIDEALGLERASVDFDNRTMTVRGKGSKQRVVPFSLELRKHLFRSCGRSEGRFIFAARDGQKLRYRNAYRDIKLVCERAGIVGNRVHPHAFRHFFAVSYIRSGGDLYRLSRILGHTSIATTQLYLRSMTAEQVGQAHCSPLTVARSA